MWTSSTARLSHPYSVDNNTTDFVGLRIKSDIDENIGAEVGTVHILSTQM